MTLKQRFLQKATLISLLIIASSILVCARAESPAGTQADRGDRFGAILGKQSLKKRAARQKEENEPQEKLPPSLPSDPAIASGTLSNGMTYYIVTNSTEIGMAEFTLVRKLRHNTDIDSVLAPTRSTMTDMPRFKGRSARTFYTGSGAYSLPVAELPKGGVATVRDNAVIYRFGVLPVSTRSSITDSTLLMMFGIVEAVQADEMLPAGYSTSDNAIIVTGDVDKASILAKMEDLSLLVENVTVPGGEPREYVWTPADSVVCTVDTNRANRTAVLSFKYALQRTPDKYMPTSLLNVSSYYGDVLGLILKRRIYAEMRGEDIPLADVECTYRTSAEVPGDESYEISLCVDPRDVLNACRVVGSVISDIRNTGIPRKEFASTRRQFLVRLYISSKKSVLSNNEYVIKCISSFLYGATPVTDYQKWSFLGKGEADEATTAYFNNFASKLVPGSDNLTISLYVPDPGSVSAETVKKTFTESCTKVREVRKSYSINQSDTLGLHSNAWKVKVTAARTDAVSGGGMKWVFSNGMAVVYKRMETGGLFYYNLLILGGFSSVSGLDKGEGAFLNDMLDIYDVGGMKGEDFRSLLRANGITVNTEVRVSDMSIYGVAARPSLNLLMKALSSFTADGAVDRAGFDYYRRRELLRLEAEQGSAASRNAVLDSLLSPSYRYYADKLASGLRDDVADLADKYFTDQFSRVNDGVFVIVGDMNEDLMKKFLQKYMGAFPTSEIRSQRSRINYSPIAGQETHIGKGPDMSIDVAMSIPFAFTADNYMIMKTAEFALQDALNKSLAGKGAAARVLADFFSYPQERAVFVISVGNVALESLPEDEAHVSADDLLFEVRRVLKNFSVDSADLSMCKTVLKNQFKSWQSDPWYWIHMVKTRVSDVKDLNSKYSEKIDAVSAEQVSALISKLDAGSKVEYVVR